MQTQIVEIIQKAKAHVEQNGGLHSVYFVACGGSWASQCCGYMLVENQNTMELSTGHVNSTEYKINSICHCFNVFNIFDNNILYCFRH